MSTNLPDDPIERLLAWPTTRRFVLAGLFAGVAWLLRDMLLVVAAFGAARWFLVLGRDAVRARTGLAPSHATLAALAGFSLAAAGLVAVGWYTVARTLESARRDWPALEAQLRATELIGPWLGQASLAERVTEGWTHADDSVKEQALAAAQGAGAAMLHATIGAFLAILAVFEEERLHAAFATLAPRSVAATLTRWAGHVADGLAITLQFQVVVALCNTVITLPLMWWLEVPYTSAVAMFLLAAGLVPIFGNLASGALLIALSWNAHGWLAVAVFGALTFVLGKVESFYLNPRLAARHVALPAFVLTASLVTWEMMAGFVGFFLSFPFLYVVLRIRREMDEGLA
jgi:predicted PurR-regulated permease PerM